MVWGINWLKKYVHTLKVLIDFPHLQLSIIKQHQPGRHPPNPPTNHQQLQVPKMEGFLYLIRVSPSISRIHTAYVAENLHSRYLKCSLNKAGKVRESTGDGDFLLGSNIRMAKFGSSLTILFDRSILKGPIIWDILLEDLGYTFQKY